MEPVASLGGGGCSEGRNCESRNTINLMVVGYDGVITAFIKQKVETIK